MMTNQARLAHLAAWILTAPVTACGGQGFPTQPSALSAPSPPVLVLEGEPGSGDGRVTQRSRASGGETLHLGPGERRRWTFAASAEQVQYVLSVTYSNGTDGEHERLTVTVDGATVSSFENRDSGDGIEEWNVFVTDLAGTATLGTGIHTLELEVSGGDGCVEIDVMTLSPRAPTNAGSAH